MTLRSQICVSHRNVGNREGPTPRERSKLGIRRSTVRKRVKGILCARSAVLFARRGTKIQKGCYFFSPPRLRKPAENSLKAANAADYFAPAVAETERGVDQRIRSREVEVISGDPGVNEGSSKDALSSVGRDK